MSVKMFWLYNHFNPTLLDICEGGGEEYIWFALVIEQVAK